MLIIIYITCWFFNVRHERNSMMHKQRGMNHKNKLITIVALPLTLLLSYTLTIFKNKSSIATQTRKEI